MTTTVDLVVLMDTSVDLAVPPPDGVADLVFVTEVVDVPASGGSVIDLTPSEGSVDVLPAPTAVVDVLTSDVSVDLFPPESATVDVVGESVTIELTAGVAGPVGPQGPQGVPGPPGAAGSAPQSYVHDQAEAADVWVIAHPMGYYPNVYVEDSAGTEWVGVIDFIDTNNLTITFTSPFGGKAYLT